MGESTTVSPPDRRPQALLPPVASRLAGYGALALLGALQWQRMVDGLSAGKALLWVLIGVSTAAGISWAGRLRRRRRTALASVTGLALLGAYASTGLNLGLLRPGRWDDLGAGLVQGCEALASVQLPYVGTDPWPSLTLQLIGSFLCVAAALLAFRPSGRRRGDRFLSLGLLLVLVVSPVIALGGPQHPVVGVVVAVLTVCFLWLDRLPLIPGAGVAAMVVAVLLGALPLASAANRDAPWFDYKAFAEQLSPDEPVRFAWDHDYGPIDWSRDGGEVLRIQSDDAAYWKVRDLEVFAGDRWFDGGGGRLGRTEDELVPGWERRSGGARTIRVTMRRLRTRDVVGAGTTLNIRDSSVPVRPGAEPGAWESAIDFSPGDSYTAQVHLPTPSESQLEAPTYVMATHHLEDLELSTRSLEQSTRYTVAGFTARFEPFGTGGFGPAFGPTVMFDDGRLARDGDAALLDSPYARTWELAQRLRAESRTPYEYISAVNAYLQDGFSYDEIPGEVPAGTPPLEGFLFDTKSGYCQHFSGAMTLLLRMGGIPARVATGFSPGGYSKRKKAWIIRDTDAHSWVEAWFEEWGWVTFDPTPPATPARSQIAAIDRPGTGLDSTDDAAPAGADDSPQRRAGLARDTPGGAGGSDDGSASNDDDGVAWIWFLPAGVVLVALAGGLWSARTWERRQAGITRLDRALAELDAALRGVQAHKRSTTLHQLEQRLSRAPDAAAYVHALRAWRYGTSSGPPPTAAQRRALRRALFGGAGPRSRLRALWALPPWRA